MIARLNGSPESRNDGVRNMSRANEVMLSSARFVNGAIKTVPTMSVLRQVRPKRRTLSQGNLSGGAASNENSAGGVNVLSMKQLQLLLQRLQILAGLEPYGFPWRDVDFGAGARIAPDAGLAGANVKDPKTAQLDAVSFGQGSLHTLEYGFDGQFGFGLRDAGLRYDLVDDV